MWLHGEMFNIRSVEHRTDYYEMMCYTQNNSLTQRSRNVIVLLRISLQSIVKLNAPLNY